MNEQDRLRAEAQAELNYREAKADCRAFIDKYVYLKDPNVPGGVLKFNLWPAQAIVLQALLTQRLVVILKARQMGLTWLCLAYALWRCLFNPGYSVVMLSKGEREAKVLIDRVKFILERLPKWLTRPHSRDLQGFTGPTWEATTQTIIIHHGDRKPDAEMKALPASEDAGRSLTAALALLDEWGFHPFAEQIWSSAYPVINQVNGGQCIGLSTGKKGTLFETIWNGAKAGLNGFFTIFLNWRCHPQRTEAWYEETKRNLPNTYRSEYPETEADAFTVGEGAFFPEWNEEIHVIKDPAWYPGPECQLYGAYDAGFGSRACFKWYAVLPGGRAICYREYYPHAVTDPEQAKTIKQMSADPRGQPENLVAIFADPSCWNKQSSTGESTAEVFARFGVFMSPADNDIANGWRRLHQWLAPDPKGDGIPDLRFTWACANSIRTYPSCEQSSTNPEDIDRNSEHHPQDVDRYFVMSRPRPAQAKPPEPPEGSLAWHLRQITLDKESEEIKWANMPGSLPPY